MTVDFVL